MKIAELFEELTTDEQLEELELVMRLLPKATEPELVRMTGGLVYIKGHHGPTRVDKGGRWYRLSYNSTTRQWVLMTTTPDGHELYSEFAEDRVEKAIDTIRSLYNDARKHGTMN